MFKLLADPTVIYCSPVYSSCFVQLSVSRQGKNCCPRWMCVYSRRSPSLPIKTVAVDHPLQGCCWESARRAASCLPLGCGPLHVCCLHTPPCLCAQRLLVCERTARSWNRASLWDTLLRKGRELPLLEWQRPRVCPLPFWFWCLSLLERTASGMS